MNKNSIEVWKPALGLPGYQVSSHGRVISQRKARDVVMKAEKDKDGYSRVQLVKDGGQFHFVVSRLVCAAFNGPPPAAESVCCHEDNDNSNNHASNLRWDSQKGNIADKVLHGTHQAGSKHPKAEITESTALLVKKSLAAYVGTRGKLHNAVRETGVSYNIVADISRGKTWAHV